MLDENEERLVAQGLREGKADAWQALYDAYAERVWRYAARLLGAQSADVADVVQETMMAAARSARGFDSARGSLWAWMSGIAHNQIVQQIRKHAQRQRVFAAVSARDLPSNQPHDALVAAELVGRVRAVLAGMSAEYALLLTARYLDGESVAVIAVRERASEAAVRSKLARARQAFRAAFGVDSAENALIGEKTPWVEAQRG